MKKPYGIPYEEVKHYYGNCGAYFQLREFDNGYAVSIISHAHSYGGSRGDFEVAVLNAENGQIIYDSPVTHDVLGYLDFAEVAKVIAKVEALPKRNWELNPPRYSPGFAA